MDASLNIIEPTSRAESKPSSKTDGKTGTNSGFASVLSNSKESQTSGEASAGRQSLKASQEKSGEQTNTDSSDNAAIAAANTSGADSAKTEKSGVASLFGTQDVSTNASGTGQSSLIPVGAKSADAASTLGAGPATETGPWVTRSEAPASPDARTAPAQTGGLAVAQNRANALPMEIISDAQNGGRHLGQINAAGSAETKSTTPLIPGNTQEAPAYIKSEGKAPVALANAGPLLTGTSESEQNLAAKVASDLNVQPGPNAGALSDDTIPASTPSTEQASLAAASGQTNKSNAKTDGVLASQVAGTSLPSNEAVSKPAGPQVTNAQTAIPSASTPPPATPGTMGLSEPAVPTQPQQTAELASAARPANAAIEGLTPQASGKTSKAGPTAAQSQTPGPNAPATQAANAPQQQSADLAIQAVRTDAPVDLMPTLDVDGAPDMLTTGALQERVHNNLPQTTLNLRLAPGQAPIIAPNDLALHIARQVQGGTTRFEIRIDPPEMGRIEVQMDMKSKKPVQAHLFVERSETLDLLQRDARQLERALQNLGIDVDSDSLSFSLRDGDAGTEGQSGDQSSGLQTAYQVDDNDNTQDITIQTDIPMEAYGFQLVAKQGVNIQV